MKNEWQRWRAEREPWLWPVVQLQITYAIQNIAVAGDHIVAAANLYGGTHNLFENTLREQGITTTFVNPEEPGNFEKAIQENTKLIYAETLGNPNSDVIDLERVAKIAHDHGIPFVVDSTFNTHICCALSSMVRTLWCTPRQNSSEDMVRSWEELS